MDRFCDVHASPTAAKPLVFPALDRPAPGQGAQWRWVNVWATWCAPCIEEMPRLLEWQKKLQDQKVPLELLFVSVDQEAQTVASFREQHRATPDSLRLADSAALASWITELGLDAGATIPIQILVDPQKKIRCVRTGGVREDDFEIIQALLTES